MTLRLTVLGRCGSYPGPGDAASGYLLQSDTTNLWIDAGSGTFANLQRHLAPKDLHGIVLTHEHADHWSDVNGLLVAAKYGLEPFDAAPIYTTAGVRQKAEADGLASFGRWNSITAQDKIEIGDLQLRFTRTKHPVETLAVLVAHEQTTFAYSSDTGPGWSFADFGPAIDIGLCEATGLIEHERRFDGVHLSARQAGGMAKLAGVGRLYITHVWPTLDLSKVEAEASNAFGAPVTAVRTNESYEL